MFDKLRRTGKKLGGWAVKHKRLVVLAIDYPIVLFGAGAWFSKTAEGNKHWSAFEERRGAVKQLCEDALLEPLRLSAGLQASVDNDSPLKKAFFRNPLDYAATPPMVYLESALWTKKQFLSSNEESQAMHDVLSSFEVDCKEFKVEVPVAFSHAFAALLAETAPYEGQFLTLLREVIRANPRSYMVSMRFWSKMLEEPARATAPEGTT